MELPKEKDTKDPTEKNKSDGKMKSVASIPANYVSILQLQERWRKDKELKQKERDFAERGVKEKGQGRREEAIEEEPRKKLEKMGLGNKDEDAKERKKKWLKKKTNKKNQGGSVEEVVKCESKETQGEKIEDGRDREVNGHVRLNSGQGYYRNQRYDWSSTRVIKATRTMVWVKKKGENDAGGGGKH